MNLPSLSSFLSLLDKNNLLKKIQVEVDPEYEITEITDRLYRSSHGARTDVPALLFEKVKGSAYPVVVNPLGTEKSIALLLGEKPENVTGRLTEAFKAFQQAAPKGEALSWLWQNKNLLWSARNARSTRIDHAPCQDVVKIGADVDLSEFPVLKCWPLDGGKFITAGLVATQSPKTGARNLGIYRLQIHSKNEIGLHWQIQKGGGFHYAEAEALNQPLEVAVSIGPDPLLWFAGILPLPEGMDEIAFAGFLSGRPVAMARCKTVGLDVPASAEIVLEGVVRPGRRMPEGPFGDHFGHYSHQSPFPVLEIKCVTHKKNPLYHAAVVGKPPQEDKAMGEAVSKTFLPIVKMMKPELEDMWAFYEAGFHNLLAVSARQRYEKEGLKTVLGLLGEGQVSLSKVVVLTDPGVNVRDFNSLVRAIHDHFNPETDFLLLPGTAQDTLDFTGQKLNHGSKMILDATQSPGETQSEEMQATSLETLKKSDPTILDARIIEGTFGVVQTKGEGRALVQKLVKDPALKGLKIIAAVSPDVDLNDPVLLIWGVFTRFDCETDVHFASAQLKGSKPVYSGVMGIDSTWKPHYPKPVEMPPEVIEKVSRRWNEYKF